MTNFDVLYDYFTKKRVFNILFSRQCPEQLRFKASASFIHLSIYLSIHLLKIEHIQQTIKATDEMNQQSSENHLQLPRHNNLSKLQNKRN